MTKSWYSYTILKIWNILINLYKIFYFLEWLCCYWCVWLPVVWKHFVPLASLHHGLHVLWGPPCGFLLKWQVSGVDAVLMPHTVFSSASTQHLFCPFMRTKSWNKRAELGGQAQARSHSRSYSYDFLWFLVIFRGRGTSFQKGSVFLWIIHRKLLWYLVCRKQFQLHLNVFCGWTWHFLSILWEPQLKFHSPPFLFWWGQKTHRYIWKTGEYK